MKAMQVVPIFRIFDQAKALEFYVDWLEFAVDWKHTFGNDGPLYIQISKNGLVLHLSEHHGDATPGSKAFVRCKELKEYHALLTQKNYKYNKPGLEDAPWGATTMTVIDPFHNQLLFSEASQM